MNRLVLAAAFAAGALAACSPTPQQSAAPATEAAAPATPAPSIEGLPAGAYTLDKTHSTLVFRVSHLGYSNYTAQFTTFDAQLQLDPANPSAAQLSVTIDPRSLSLPNPPAGFRNELLGAQWLNASAQPQWTFRSTSVEPTGANTARITGDFSMRGVTRPVTLDATFNGGYAGHPMDPNARIGFSAHGTLKRSEFGLTVGIPAPGTTMGVSDDVEIIIETEWSGPAWTPPPSTGATPAAQ